MSRCSDVYSSSAQGTLPYPQSRRTINKPPPMIGPLPIGVEDAVYNHGKPLMILPFEPRAGDTQLRSSSRSLCLFSVSETGGRITALSPCGPDADLTPSAHESAILTTGRGVECSRNVNPIFQLPLAP